MLVVWGKYDPSFSVAGAHAYLRDVPDAQVHLLEGGHFVLDEACDETARLIRGFLDDRVDLRKRSIRFTIEIDSSQSREG
jgi:pimeloyl-ACP methyl ester carboxylesterase